MRHLIDTFVYRNYRNLPSFLAQELKEANLINMLAHSGHLLLHPALLHPLESRARACLLGLVLLLLLGGLKVAPMAELHEVARLVDLAGEAAEGLLDGLALTDLHLDGGQGGSGSR